MYVNLFSPPDQRTSHDEYHSLGKEISFFFLGTGTTVREDLALVPICENDFTSTALSTLISRYITLNGLESVSS